MTAQTIPPAVSTPQAEHPSVLWALWTSLRPYQWTKNTLVFGGLIFSHSLLNSGALWTSLLAFVWFCCASSGVYLLNDLHDISEDRLHPTKQFRPIASGALNQSVAAVALVTLFLLSIWRGVALQRGFGIILIIYVVLNVSYTLLFKYVVILDVLVVAVGFVCRAVAGAVAIGVTASPWLILCTLMLALLVACGKRRSELVLLSDQAANHRKSLKDYSLQFLDLMMSMTGASVVITYALYTLAPETTTRFRTSGMVLTTPAVIYGVFRYLYLVHKRREGGDPARLLLKDWPTLINAFLWVGLVCVILYGPRDWVPW
ncbi:MAG: decaprenyl-phosphate phosphoribosyltransferase [Acidobacteriia bacterium]|nr:decaprenyl-phosphate phosphoribosyltransferase [Terriglobia bacterium]